MNNLTRVSPRTGLALSILLFTAIGAGNAQETGIDIHRWLECSASWLSVENDSGPNFTAKVSFREDPVSAVRVLLTREDAQPDERDWNVVATGETDQGGIAPFFAIPSGKDRIRVEGALLSPGSEEIAVDEEDHSTTEIRFEWPGKSVQARNLRGRIMLSHEANQKPMPLQNVLVQLLDLRTGKLLGQTRTSDHGTYELAPSTAGLYVVRFNEDAAGSDFEEMAVEVRENAINEGIPALRIVKTKCSSEISQQPDEKLFERAMSAADHNRFAVAYLSLQTLINTYPDSEFAEQARLVMQDPRFAGCGESFSLVPDGCESALAPTSP